MTFLNKFCDTIIKNVDKNIHEYDGYMMIQNLLYRYALFHT